MSLTCTLCATPLPDGTAVVTLGRGLVHSGSLVDVKEYDFLCPACGKAIEAEIANITEPNRLVFEIAPELRPSGNDRVRVFKLLSWFMEYSDTLALRLGTTVLRVRVELADIDENYRLVVTSTMGQHIFLWSYENSLLVGEGDEDQRLVLDLNTAGVAQHE